MSFICPAQPGSAADTMRTLTFPEDQSYGSIYVAQDGWRPYRIGTAITNERYQARGTIKIEKGKRLWLVGNFALSEHMEILKQLPPDALTKLDLGRLPIDGKSLANLKHLTSLQMLDLDQTDVDDQGMQYIKGLKNLEFLSLSRGLITGKTLSEISTLTKLKRLHIGHCELIPQSLAVLIKLKALRYLHLGCTGLNDATLDYVKPLVNLVDLTVDGNKGITDKGLAKLKQLKQLVFLDLVDDPKVTEAGLLGLKGVPLITLKVQKTGVNQLALDKLKKCFPGCSIEIGGTGKYPSNFFAPLH